MSVITTMDSVAETLSKNWLISSDSHIIEHPRLFEGRMPKHLEDRTPHVVRGPDGDFRHLDGYKLCSFSSGVDTGQRFIKGTNERELNGTFDEVPSSCYDPRAYLDDNETDGVWGTVIYPTLGLVLFYIPDTELVTGVFGAYNDWLAEFCSEDPSRLKGIAMVNVDDPDEGTRELERCRALGLAGAMITCAPPSWAPYRSDVYERFWATAQDLDMPLSMHCATERGRPEGRTSGVRPVPEGDRPQLAAQPRRPDALRARRPHVHRGLRALPRPEGRQRRE